MKKIALTSSMEGRNTYLRTRYIRHVVTVAEQIGVEVMPIILPITAGERLIAQYAREFDGYIFTGGDDVDPMRYGEEKHEKCGDIEAERDEFEFSLLEKLIALDRPVYGICRGSQVMNVALGGSLWQDFPSMLNQTEPHVKRDEDGTTHHFVKTSGFLRDLTGEEIIHTNSYHHQSVKKVGSGLVVCGMSTDGIVEAFEHTSLSFYRAVQWHPELDPDDISYRLLKSFIDFI